MFNLLITFAQFERSLIAERVKAGMSRARKQGKHVGRPPALNGEWEEVQPLIEHGQISQVEAARRLGVSRTTIYRMLQKGGNHFCISEPRTTSHEPRCSWPAMRRDW